MGFLGGAALLTASVAVRKLRGALYKITLGNLLGSRGMGCFQAAYNVYGVLLTLSTAGLPLAMSRLIAQSRGRPRRQRRIFHVALALFLALGLVALVTVITLPAGLLVGILSGYYGGIKDGSYVLNTAQTVDEMLEILAGVNTEGQPSAE